MESTQTIMIVMLVSIVFVSIGIPMIFAIICTCISSAKMKKQSKQFDVNVTLNEKNTNIKFEPEEYKGVKIGISDEDLKKLVIEEISSVDRIHKYLVNGSIAYFEIGSISGQTYWECKISFDDDGVISGNKYQIIYSNWDSNIPNDVANRICNRIHNLVRSNNFYLSKYADLLEEQDKKIHYLYNALCMKYKYTIKLNKMLFRYLIVLIICAIGIIGILGYKIGDALKFKEVDIAVKYDSDYLCGLDYIEVSKMIEANGFTNINLYEVDDLSKNELSQKNKVEWISIDNVADFDKNALFKNSDSVDIKYHVAKNVAIGMDTSDVIGKKYDDVVKIFEDKGFLNITLVQEDDLVLGLVKKNGEISKITIGGDENFKAHETVGIDEEICIYYHTFEEKRK